MYGQIPIQNNANLSIPGQYTYTNSILYSPNLLALRTEKFDQNAHELISNIDIDQKNKLTVDNIQHRSHNFSAS